MGAEPQTVKQCALHAVTASLVRKSVALHGARVPLRDSVCFDRVSGFLQVGAGATPSRCVPPCGQRDSDQTADVDGEFCETDRLHEVLESTAAPSLVAETDQLRAESESSGPRVCWHPGGHSAWRGRVGGLRLRRQAHGRLGDFIVDPLSASHHVDHVHTRSVGCVHGEHDLHDARTNSCLGTDAARVNSFGLHAARINSGGHANSYRCTKKSCGGVRGGTKPLSTSTRCQDRCPGCMSRRGQDAMGTPACRFRRWWKSCWGVRTW